VAGSDEEDPNRPDITNAQGGNVERDFIMDTTLSSFSDTINLSVSQGAVSGGVISDSNLQTLRKKASTENSIIAAGITAIGGLMATAAVNDDASLNYQELEDLGLLLRYLGRMQKSLGNLDQELRVIRDIAAKPNRNQLVELKQV